MRAQPCLHQIANHQHGTKACYVLDKCRCEPCLIAVREYETTRRRLNAYGRSNLVDAEPVREHVRDLMAGGMGLKTIGRAAGVSGGVISKLMYGIERPDGTKRPPAKRVTKRTAARILAVELALAPGARLGIEESLETKTKVRALIALGWSQNKLAERLGMAGCNFGRLVNDDRCVLVSTAQAVERLFRELSMTPPPEDDHRSKIAASRSRNLARAKGWLPPLALPDLDDDVPQVTHIAPRYDLDPVVVERFLSGDRNVPTSYAERCEIVRRWTASGRSLQSLERETGWATHRYTEKDGAA